MAFRKRTFFGRLILWMLLLLVMFLPMDLLYGSYTQNRLRLENTVKQANLFLKALDLYAPDGYAGRGPVLDLRLETLGSMLGVSYFYLSDWQGNIIYTYPGGLAGDLAEAGAAANRSLLKEAKAIYDAPTIYTTYLAELGVKLKKSLQTTITMHGEKMLNTVQLLQLNPDLLIGFGVPATGLLSFSGSFIFSSTFTALAALLLLGLGIVMVVRRVIKPIDQIAEYAGKVAAHDFSATLDIDPDNELNGLASAMRSMGGEISEYLAALEEKVKMATSDSSYALEQLTIITNSINDGLLVLDSSLVIVRCNEFARVLFNWPSDLPGRSLSELPPFNMKENGAEYAPWAAFFRRLSMSPEFSFELPLFCGGQFILLESHVTNKKIIDRHMTVCIFRDVTQSHNLQEELRRSRDNLELMVKERTSEFMRINAQLRLENAERHSVEQALLQAESRYRDIVDNAIEGVFQRAMDGSIISANPSLARILGYGSVEDLLSAYSDPKQLLCYSEEMENTLYELLELRGRISGVEFQAITQDASPVWVSMNARLVTGQNGEPAYYEAFLTDITSRKKTEEKLLHQAFHDPLTNLPNRTLFQDRLTMVLRKAKRHQGYKFAVLYLDLDRFKNINDIFGHKAGDEVLIKTARQIQFCVREADTVARFGGDEFAVLLDGIEHPHIAIEVSRRICKSLEQPMVLNGLEARMAASIGVVINGDHYHNPEDLLRDVDTAMYNAKNHERRQIMVFNERMREETEENLALEYDLRKAIERKEIMMHYQPLIEVVSGRLYGFEALMRWTRNGTNISPTRFIPIAEESELINSLSLHMLTMVCTLLKNWEEEHGINDITIHVNISSRQFMSPTFRDDVGDILEKTGASADRLIFEITESVLLDYGKRVIGTMEDFKKRGIRFCLDDFGTGFSSLSYLRILPIDSMKIDRSFIAELETDQLSFSIMRNLIAMGHDLGLTIVTEGIERASQIDALLSTGCRFAQGYYFSKPMSPEDALAFSLTTPRLQC